MIEKLKVRVWSMIYNPYFSYLFYKERKERAKISIVNTYDTVQYIVDHKCSVSRFGDGEIQMITHLLENSTVENFAVDTFQGYNPALAKRLSEILLIEKNNHIVGLPYPLLFPKGYNSYSKLFWKRVWVEHLKRFPNILHPDITYFDSTFTRFYIDRDVRWRANCAKYVCSLKRIWENEDICFLEGSKSRLGIGNDLFDNARSVQRFLFPATNAFDKYEEILAKVSELPKNKLYLIALGHTATVLAYDMAQLGFWAIDVGHIDIEYEWMKMKAKHKVPIPNKYVNEVKDGRIATDFKDELYNSQIIGRIE